MKFLVILGSGGHTAQMLKLVQKLGKNHNYEYVINEEDNISKKKIKIKGKVFRFKKTREINEFRLISIIKQFFAIMPAIRLLKKTKPDAIITCGPNFAIPIMIVGKFLGIKSIFVESWSRIYKKSFSGMGAYLFADLFFVQWPEMKKLYPKAIYAGRLA